MHRPSLIMVLSSIFAAGSLRVATEEDGIPMWVWPVLILMVGFLVWWWLRKPAEEVSASFLSKRSEHPQSTMSPLIAETPSAPARPKTGEHKITHGATPRPVTAESSISPETEDDRDQNLPAVPPINVKPDDLTIVEGIGPKINQVLHAAGIQSLSQLSDSEIGQLKAILLAEGIRRADPITWPAQAKLAAAGDLETLRALQATLRVGRATERQPK
jgi:predicted flap endonuclease-1-like 5' DNA nuclease